MTQFLYYEAHELCHWGHDMERGGECHRGEYKYGGNRYISISYRIFMFGAFLQGNTFITPFLLMSLCCIINDIIYLAQNYK